MRDEHRAQSRAGASPLPEIFIKLHFCSKSRARPWIAEELPMSLGIMASSSSG